MPNNRNNIKWAPFNAVINGENVLTELTQSIDIMPELSEEQILELEEKIINNYTYKIKAKYLYFNNNNYKEIDGYISKIDEFNKIITINGTFKIKFTNIIKIY